ncbi:D-alanyl-D-alanine carboxypeptidase (penicillin-binding protein 5/6) [Agromyces sp. CF514]|uniref:serine hydrolase n=1 Tax=Agromyces sp. CF514 TaxID=1881031 RepID=UPI0008EAB1E1|nr:serine hydrolase [Agromyces sp. CF514]SFR75814.1 D-alanyl-D-alanine carboxypeptidase (penicillin-binding protein 5/6) [Agromyces sp. CF514]
MSSPARVLGIVVGAIAILAVGVYAPAMLLGPLPAVTVQQVSAAGSPESAPLALPADGATALAVVGDDGTSSVLATAGSTEAVPMGGAAKLVTILATLESLPLPAPGEGEGPSIKIGPADYTDYLRYQADGSRALQVSPGDSWTQRDVVRAILLTSSNNHADTLARWAFGTVDAYVDGANSWLADQGLTTTKVADATGLSGDNVTTAEELAKLTGLLLANPSLSAMLDDPDATELGAHAAPDLVDRSSGDGVREVTRSYTDQAGLSSVFTAEVELDGAADGAGRIIGVMLLMPDYETLDPAIEAAVASVKAAAVPVTIITEGTAYAKVRSAWGASSDVVATVTRTESSWGATFDEPTVTIDPFTTSSDARDVGRVTISTGAADVSSPLRLSSAIRDPGPIWRLTHPFPVISAFVEAQAP